MCNLFPIPVGRHLITEGSPIVFPEHPLADWHMQGFLWEHIYGRWLNTWPFVKWSLLKWQYPQQCVSILLIQPVGMNTEFCAAGYVSFLNKNIINNFPLILKWSLSGIQCWASFSQPRLSRIIILCLKAVFPWKNNYLIFIFMYWKSGEKIEEENSGWMCFINSVSRISWVPPKLFGIWNQKRYSCIKVSKMGVNWSEGVFLLPELLRTSLLWISWRGCRISHSTFCGFQTSWSQEKSEDLIFSFPLDLFSFIFFASTQYAYSLTPLPALTTKPFLMKIADI